MLIDVLEWAGSLLGLLGAFLVEPIHCGDAP